MFPDLVPGRLPHSVLLPGHHPVHHLKGGQGQAQEVGNNPDLHLGVTRLYEGPVGLTQQQVKGLGQDLGGEGGVGGNVCEGGDGRGGRGGGDVFEGGDGGYGGDCGDVCEGGDGRGGRDGRGGCDGSSAELCT